MKRKSFLTIGLLFYGLSYVHADRWIAYTSSQSVDCSTYTNGGKLTSIGSDIYCADDTGGSTASFLSTTIAASTYLTQSSATTTYFPLISSTTLLTTSSATATYLNNVVTISNSLIDVSSVTKQGNTFNSGSHLLQLSSGLVPNANIDGSSVTKYGSSIPSSSIASGSLGSSVIVSSIAINAVQDASIVGVGGAKITGTASIPNAAIDGSSVTKYGTSIPAASIASGSLGASVIASSIAVNAVQDASVVGVSASKITGTGTLPNAAVDGSSITKQGNTFNGNSQLVQTDSAGAISLSVSTFTTLNTTTLKNGGVTGITLSGTNGTAILGNQTNTAASAGNIGELIEKISTGAVSQTSGNYSDGGNIGILLTKGIWDIQSVAVYSAAATTTVEDLSIGIGTVAGNDSTGVDNDRNVAQYQLGSPGLVITSNRSFIMNTPTFRVRLATSTTYYPKLRTIFATSTMTASANIRATRVQ